jgi:hypothetical protein
MKRIMNRILAGVASSFLALTLCTAAVQAESPVRKVTLAAHDFVLNPSTGLWHGTLTLTIDGEEYTGSGVWWITRLTVVNGRYINDNNLHYFAAAIYDFGELGWFEIWENGIMDWGIMTPEYRLSTIISAVNRIVGGTGAFANAHGTLHSLWYELEVAGPGQLPVVNALLWGRIYGFELGD